MSSEHGSEALWTPKELGAFLKVSRSWIYARVEAGLFPCLHVGGLLRFSPTQVKAWLESQQRKSAQVISLRSGAGNGERL